MRFGFTIICFFSVMIATTNTQAQERIWLYPTNTPDIFHTGFDSLPPFIDYYPSKITSSNKSAIVICPGGAYAHLAWEKEGTVVAAIFNAAGIDAFVLRYRLNNRKQEGHTYPAQYNDVTTAIQLIRSGKAGKGINPSKIGVLGFSAGGHLASTAATIHKSGNPAAANWHERFSSRPDFAILLYPVISMDTLFGHRYSREMLLGKAPSAEMVYQLSTQNRITKDTPPTFLVHSSDDKAVPLKNSEVFYEALKKLNIPSALTIYDHGGHGFGTAPSDPVLAEWPSLCIE
ncbi:MAG: alpha/beta hydrolase [Sediminibacterium sp.]|nr:alpha/beta hydrolase [Sediminibacterium sp.]